MSLASRFATGAASLHSTTPLTNAQIAAKAPSIFAMEPHESRSQRYTYIPTINVLNELRKEGFQPFMVCQTRTRKEDRRDFTKHMIRLRHASQITAAEANEIILLNSHDGTSSYQLLAGMFRFVCKNGMVCGEVASDVRVRHSGNIVDDVVEGAFDVLASFEQIGEQRDEMKALALTAPQRNAFATAARELRWNSEQDEVAPVVAARLLQARREADSGDDLWSTMNRVQENLTRGGLPGRTRTNQRTTTRAVTGIDQNVKLNRALWVLSEEMRKLAV